MSDTATVIDAWLPQTQCTRCGYPRCRAYAEAIACGEADINQCPPGGNTTIDGIAMLLHVAAKPLDPAFGVDTPRTRAVIDETVCIGCKKCIDACPTDAIVGAAKLMHTVIAADCTGCGLCLPPCPVDCIALIPVSTRGERWRDYRNDETHRWRALTERRLQRLTHVAVAEQGKRSTARDAERARIRAEITAAVARSRARRAAQPR